MMVMYCAINFVCNLSRQGFPVLIMLQYLMQFQIHACVQTEDYHGQILLCVICSIKHAKFEKLMYAERANLGSVSVAVWE